MTRAAQSAVAAFQTSGGAEIFRIPVEVFPSFTAYVYLVLLDGMRILVDTGSGFGNSNRDLETGLQAAGELAGVSLGLSDLTHVLVSHGHIDHFGGLAYVQPRTAARIGVHELDFRNITHYEERVALVTRRLSHFLWEAGLDAEQHAQLLSLYQLNKSLFRSTPVDFTFEAVHMRLGAVEMLHLPGHCAGQTAFRLHNIVLIGDHVLSKTTPHMAPESLTLNTGLGHYLASLRELENWLAGVDLLLPAHEEPISDIPGRLSAIREHHAQRLEKILRLLETPKTIAEISHELFRQPEGYNALLAVEEAGAHVEHLYQRGLIHIANLDEMIARDQVTPLRYVRAESPGRK